MVIATLGIFSGEGAAATNSMVRGIELAIRQYNSDSESSYEVRLHREDTKGSADGTTQAATNITSTELLIGVVGPFAADEAGLAGPLLDQSQIPFLVPNVTEGDLSQRGWSSFRRLVADDRREGEALAAEILRRTKKIVLIHDGSGPGQDAIEGAKGVLEAAGAGVRIDDVPLKPAGKDWAAITRAVVQDAPEAVLFGGEAPGKAGALIASLRGGGYKGRYYTSHFARDPAFITAAGEAGAGTFTSCVCAEPSDSRLRRLVAAFRQTFSARLHPFAAEAYEGTLMLLEAIEEVEPKPASVTEFLRSAPNFLGDTKHYEFDPSGELVRPQIWLYELSGGAWRPAGRSPEGFPAGADHE